MDEFNGAIFRENPTDYILGGETGSIIDLEKLQTIRSDEFQYNQLEFKEYGRMLCTLYAPLGMLSCNNNEVIQTPARKKLVELRMSKPDFGITTGGYLDEGVKTVIDGHKNGVMYRVNKQMISKLTDKGYVVNIGIYTGGDVTANSKDGVLTDVEINNIIKAPYGHSTLIRTDKRQNSYYGVLENNMVKIESFNAFINSWYIYQNAYIILPNKVVRDYFYKLLEGKTKLEAFKYYDMISEKLYPKERDIFQYCLQKIYIGKINTLKLKLLTF